MRFARSEIDGDTEQWRLLDSEGMPVPFAEVIAGWGEDHAFRTLWHSRLRSYVPFPSYCWECPPVTAATIDRPFECVFVASPLLAEIAPDRMTFAEHFRTGGRAAGFASLGRDAWLVAPVPERPGSDFGHIGSFVANASPETADGLWQTVGRAMADRIGEPPVWLSTAGLGVAWLHVRLDSRPKYYRFGPYRRTA